MPIDRYYSNRALFGIDNAIFYSKIEKNAFIFSVKWRKSYKNTGEKVSW